MAKVTINGEVFEFDRSRKPLAEMLALEKALGIPYGQWEADLSKGSARALAGFVWLVWRREGRDVRFADIESGAVDVDLAAFDVAEDPEPEEEAGPTMAAAGHDGAVSPLPSAATGRSSTGRTPGSSHSAKSASAPGKSASST